MDSYPKEPLYPAESRQWGVGLPDDRDLLVDRLEQLVINMTGAVTAKVAECDALRMENEKLRADIHCLGNELLKLRLTR